MKCTETKQEKINKQTNKAKQNKTKTKTTMYYIKYKNGNNILLP